MTFEIFSLLTYPLMNAAAAFVLLLVLTIFYKDRVWAILKKDRLGWGGLVLSILMVGSGLWITAGQPDNFVGAWLQTVGGLLLGASVLVVLPDNVTKSLVDWRNIGVVIGFAGLGAGLYGLFLILYPFVEIFQNAWEALKANFEWRYLYLLIGGPLLAGLGYLIKAFRFQKRKEKPIEHKPINERITMS